MEQRTPAMKLSGAITHAGLSVLVIQLPEPAMLGEVAQIRLLVPSGGIISSIVSALSGMKSHLFVSSLEKPCNTIGSNKLVSPCVDEGKCRHIKYEASLVFSAVASLIHCETGSFPEVLTHW